MRLFGYDVTATRLAPRKPPAQGHQVYVDAMHLLVRHFQGKPWSRRHNGGMPDRRWRQAFALLRASGIATASGYIESDPVSCMYKLWQYDAQQKQLRRGGNYVPALPK